LLRNGFYAPPADLLHIVFGRDLSQRQLVDDSMNILQARIEALAELYKKSDAKH
jgi:oligoendopeptidase F